MHQIKTGLDRVTEIIKVYEKKSRESVEQHLLDLREKREELESMKSDNSQFIQDNNVVEVIRAREERIELMKTASQPYNLQLNLPSKIEVLRGTNTSLSAQTQNQLELWHYVIKIVPQLQLIWRMSA